MTKVVSQERLVEVTIAMRPSRIEVFSGLHDGHFWGVDHHDIVFDSGTLRRCFIVGVLQSSRTGTITAPPFLSAFHLNFFLSVCFNVRQ
jgi:hypothetical protein